MTPRDAALKRLTVREYSVTEMLAYLARKGFEESEARETVAELQKEGLIDDSRYARAVTRHQSKRGKGPRYILGKLAQKGVRADLREVRNLYADLSDEGEVAAARKVVETRYPQAWNDAREKQRAFQALLRRGFSAEVAREILCSPRS